MSTALYRRYRPDSFIHVIGQDHVTTPLRAALRANRVTHAYLFSGPRGCGKTTSARILARCLNCAQGPTDTPCGQCDSCRELATGGPGSLDVVEIDAASHGGVDDARDLRERATFAPVRDRYKVFIIDEAHMVTAAGFNALLKLVEEPPEHVKFVFATTEPDRVIGTIRSRTHHYPFRLVPPDVLIPYLRHLCEEEHIHVEDGVLPMVMRAGGGSVRDSLSVLDQLMAGAIEGALAYDTAVALLGYTDAALLDQSVDALAGGDGAAIYRVVERMIDSGHEPRRFVEDLLQRLRDLLIIAVAGDGAGEVLADTPSDQLERMFVQARNWGPRQLSRAADLTDEALRSMSGATSPRLQLELLVGRILVPTQEWAQGHAQTGTLSQEAPVPRTVGMRRGGAPNEEQLAAEDPAPRRRLRASQAREEDTQFAASSPRATAEKKQSTQVLSPSAVSNEEARSSSGWAVREPGQGVVSDTPAAPDRKGKQERRPSRADTQDVGAATRTRQDEPVGPDQRGQQEQRKETSSHHEAREADMLRDRWTEVVHRLAGINRATWHLVTQNGQLGGIDADVVVVLLPTDGQVANFTNARRGEHVAAAIHETTGLRRTVIARTGQAGGGTPVSLPSAPVNESPARPRETHTERLPRQEEHEEYLSERHAQESHSHGWGEEHREDYVSSRESPATTTTPAHSQKPTVSRQEEQTVSWEPVAIPGGSRAEPSSFPSDDQDTSSNREMEDADAGDADPFGTYLPGDPDAQWDEISPSSPLSSTERRNLTFDDSAASDPFADNQAMRETREMTTPRATSHRETVREEKKEIQDRENNVTRSPRPSAAEDDTASLDDRDADFMQTAGLPAVLEILGGTVVDTTYEQGE